MTGERPPNANAALAASPGPIGSPWRILAFASAVIYPTFWLAQFASSSLPALLRMAWGSQKLLMVRVSVVGSFLVSGAAGDPPMRFGYPYGAMGASGLVGVLVAMGLAVAALWLTRRRAALLGGMFVTLLGYTGCEGLLRELFRRSPGAGWIAGALIFGGMWTMGLRRLAAVTTRPAAGFGWRFASTLVAFTAPAGLLWLTLHWVFGMRILQPFVWLFVPGLVPALVAASKPIRSGASASARMGWKFTAAGAATTIALGSTLALAGPAIGNSFVQERAARARAMVASLPEVAPGAAYEREFFQRGVNFTAEYGAPYASVEALESLRRLREYGVNSVALVVYGWTSEGRPSVQISRGLGVWESEEGVENLARMAHALGMKVFLKPQLWVRGGSPTSLDFPDREQRERWFRSYGEFIGHYARLATRIHADLFCVGVELAKLSRYDDRWRALIAQVRQIYPGPLTYAANFGRDFQEVRFWNDLDYIGLDEYYPLPADLSTGGLVRRVERVAVEYRRPVLFTEVGFRSVVDAQRDPWNDAPRPLSLDEQRRCYEAIFGAFYARPWFAGMYWWQVGTNGAGGTEDDSFTPWGKPAMDVVREWYTTGGR